MRSPRKRLDPVPNLISNLCQHRLSEARLDIIPGTVPANISEVAIWRLFFYLSTPISRMYVLHIRTGMWPATSLYTFNKVRPFIPTVVASLSAR